ncbi:MAG TPA: hypothetical protein VG222_00395 [Vicinamibacterales bacterium]|jgi:hypothetical protein|nr:hypothetical protein [Vicinamibacterales bacterium]
MFTPQDRDRVRDRVLEWAASDSRVVAGAVVGSLAHGPGDRFSDLDLTFGLADGVPIADVLEDWSRRLTTEFDAVHLFDLPSAAAMYRVFLLRGCLQFDLSFAPAAEFGAIGPQFRLLFGAAADKTSPAAPSPSHLFGYGVHHAVRARVCIERRRYWQAEYWTSAVRDYALAMACVRLKLSPHYGRGFDDLPDHLRDVAAPTLVRSVDRAELLRALRRGADLLLAEGAAASACSPQLTERLRDFMSID